MDKHKHTIFLISYYLTNIKITYISRTSFYLFIFLLSLHNKTYFFNKMLSMLNPALNTVNKHIVYSLLDNIKRSKYNLIVFIMCLFVNIIFKLFLNILYMLKYMAYESFMKSVYKYPSNMYTKGLHIIIYILYILLSTFDNNG